MLQEGANLLEFLTLSSPSPNTFTTTTLSARGPSRAFGGCTIAFAIAAASQDIPSNFHCYSVLGTFLGPALFDRVLTAEVKSLRSTRSFQSRYVEISQVLDGGERRNVMVVLADFCVPDENELFVYSRPPDVKYSGVEESLTPEVLADRLAEKGYMTQEKRVAMREAKPEMRSSSFEQRFCPEGITGQTLSGAGGQRVQTSQDDLPMHARTSGDWFRSKQTLTLPLQHWAFLAFVLDGPTGWLPLLHDQRGLDEFEAVASLEFALRIMPTVKGGKGFDGNEWNLREMKSSVAGGGRTFYEGKVWNQEGRCLASFSQMDIARPKRSTVEKL